MKHNLENHRDWIVLNTSMETLARWSKKDEALRAWPAPQLERLRADTRKSVAGRAAKWLLEMKKWFIKTHVGKIHGLSNQKISLLWPFVPFAIQYILI